MRKVRMRLKRETVMTHDRPSVPPRMQIAQDVLEAARDAGDPVMVSVCRRVLTASRLGWKKHGDKTDLQLVLAFHAQD